MPITNLSQVLCAQKENFIARTQALHQHTLKLARKKDESDESYNLRKTYQFSICLLLAGSLGATELYRTIDAEFLKTFDRKIAETDFPFWLWMMSRRLLSAQLCGNAFVIRESQTYLNTISELYKEEKPTAHTTWAKGNQLAFHALSDAKGYEQHKADTVSSLYGLTNHQKSLDDQSNAMWATVLIIYATALNKDKDQYGLQLKRLRQTAQTESIATILKQKIQIHDFLLWAGSLLLNAAAIMQDDEAYKDLASFLSTILGNLPAPGKDRPLGEDILLAEVNIELAKANKAQLKPLAQAA